MKRADEAWVFEADNVTRGREDQRFYAGDQWDEASKKARGTSRPMLTVNRLPTFVRQLTGDVRQNPPAVKVLPAKGPASQQTADILNGVIRDIEAESDAVACYVYAVDNAAQSGQGAFRIVTEYADDEGFDQEIRIRPIRDPFGVMVDPMAQFPDKSDMDYAFVFERMSVAAFRTKYPDASVDDAPMGSAAVAGSQPFSWRTGDTVRVAEYWRKEITNRTVYQLEDGSTSNALPKGAQPKNRREVTDTRIVMYMVSGKEVLSGPHLWAGKMIPICVVPGEESTIDGATLRRGIIRDAKDAQRLYNYARTAAAESIALQPKVPFLLTPNMIAGYEDMWDTAGTENHPYLLYQPDKLNPSGLPQRSQPALGQQGLDSQAMLSAQDIEAVTGIFKANLGAPSNETSGKAILSRQKEGDTGTFLYIDNLRRAIAYCGRCLVDLIPKIYDGERIVRMLKEDGSAEMVPVNKATRPQTLGGQSQVMNDLSVGKYSVQVSTGPSYLTRRQETAQTLVQLTQSMPLVGQVGPDLVVKALDFPGGDELAARLERTIPPQIKGDAPPQPPPPNPKDVADAARSAAQAKLYNAQAEETEIKAIAEALPILQSLAAIPQTLAALKAQVDSLGGAGPMQPAPGAPPMLPGGPPVPPPPGAPPQASNGLDLAELEPIGESTP
ncbi:MAG: hypothetical protein JSR91_00250 [Proteobacteria bacterium]|nr:hypothetical protein [Pseudomonadota bacterium]